MKMAFVVTAYPDFYTTFTFNTIDRLRERGIEITIVAPSQNRGRIINEQRKKRDEQVIYLCDYNWRGGRSVSRWLSLQGQRLARHVSKALYLAIGRLMRPGMLKRQGYERYYADLGWNTYGINRVAKELVNRGMDLIHAGFGNDPATVAMLLSRRSGIPFSFESHAYDLFAHFPFAEEKVRQACAIFTISHYNKRYLEERHDAQIKKVSVMRVPIDLSHCDKITSKQRVANQLISVARLHPIKGLDIAIRAVAKIRPRFQDVKLVIYGHGSEEEMLNKLIEELDAENYIEMRGSAGNNIVLEEVARSALFVLPSRVAENGDRDGIPTSMIEAMYLGTPVVSTKVSGIPELVVHGSHGYLAEENDVEGVAAYIEALLENDKLRQEMGRACTGRVEKEFYKEISDVVMTKTWRNICGIDV